MISATSNWQTAAAVYQASASAQQPILLLTIGKASLSDSGGYPRILASADVSGLLSNSYPWVLIDPVELAQSVNDLEGSSNLSDVSVPCLDGDLLPANAHAITGDIAGGYSFPGKTAILWLGFAGLALADFCQIATMIVDHTDYEEDGNVLTFSLRDNALFLNGFCFITAQNGALTGSNNPCIVRARPFDAGAGLVVTALEDAGFPSSLISLTSLAYLDQNIYFDLNMQFEVSYPPVAKNWVENEIMKALGCVWYWNALGQFSAYSLLPAVPPTPALTLGQDDIDVQTFPSPIESQMYTSAFTYRMDCDSQGQNAGTIFADVYPPAEALYGFAQARAIQSRGVRSALGGMRLAHLMANMIFRRYGLKPLTLKPRGFAPCLRLEVGDKLLITHPQIPNGKFPAALRDAGSNLGVTGTLWEVIGTRKQLAGATVDIDLLHVSWQLATNSWEIAPDATPAYTSASSLQKSTYFFVCGSNNKYSNGDPAHTLW